MIISGGIWISDEDDEADDYRDDEHEARHPWWFAGCADCDERADRREAGR